MKSSRALLWAALCVLPLAPRIAQAQVGSPYGSIWQQPAQPAGVDRYTGTPIGQPPPVLPADGAPPIDGSPGESACSGCAVPCVPVMLSSPLGAPVGITFTTTTPATSRTVLTPTTVTTPQPVTLTTLQTTKIRIVKVTASSQIVVSFRTVTVPVTTSGTVNNTTTVNIPHTVNTPAKTVTEEFRVPSIGGYRIADNESPLPQTRVFYFLNDFQSPFDAANSGLGGHASLPYAVRNTFGFEQAFAQGRASVELRLPINSLKADSSIPGVSGDDTAIGDLFLVSKVLFYRSEAGSAVSGGLAMTLPTANHTFAGVDQGDNVPNHHVNLQPYIGYLWRPTPSLYVQGFSSFDVPMSNSDVTVMYNDIGIGYFAYQGTGWVTAVTPTVELRVTTPLNHNGVLDSDIYAETHVVQCLGGVTMELGGRATLTVGAGVPLTGPKPYDWEFLTQINFRF